MRKQIDRISANRTLDMINAAGFANGVNPEQQRMYKNLIKIAFPNIEQAEDEYWRNPPKGLIKVKD